MQGTRMKKHLLSLLACLTCFPYTAAVASQTGPAIGSIAPNFKARNLVTGAVTPSAVSAAKSSF